MEEILRAHAGRYPLMEPTDGVKLLYQSEFAGGHMIRSAESCLEYLRREYAQVTRREIPLLEDLGDGILRVHLAALEPDMLEALGQAFLRSAQLHQGRQERFLEKLELLRQLTGQGLFAFDSRALDAYLGEYARQGYPAVSHSQRYRRAYSPAYRVVRADCIPW